MSVLRCFSESSIHVRRHLFVRQLKWIATRLLVVAYAHQWWKIKAFTATHRRHSENILQTHILLFVLIQISKLCLEIRVCANCCSLNNLKFRAKCQQASHQSWNTRVKPWSNIPIKTVIKLAYLRFKWQQQIIPHQSFCGLWAIPRDASPTKVLDAAACQSVCRRRRTRRL